MGWAGRSLGTWYESWSGLSENHGDEREHGHFAGLKMNG
jgi:hypothetical protein